jgi:hypothetical protein
MKRDQTKRQQWQQHIAQWQQSALSQRAFCVSAGLKFATFDYWRRALIAEQSVENKPSQSQQPGIQLLPLQVTPAGSGSMGLVLRCPQGWELRLPPEVKADWLSDLLRGL